jgi:glycosyltransferase involved in cell wall biosynthesis
MLKMIEKSLTIDSNEGPIRCLRSTASKRSARPAFRQNPNMTFHHRFAVIQVGARMHYAVPALLAQAGMLEVFYTDIHAGDWPVQLGLSWWPKAMRPKSVQRLLGRRLPAVLAHTTRTVPFAAIRCLITNSDIEPPIRRALERDGFGAANALYTLSNGDIEVVRKARRAGLFVVHEQILNPDVGRILHEERERFPGIEPQEPLDQITADERRDIDQWQEAQLLLAPSEFVREGMIRMGADQDKIAIVEYGLPKEWLDTVSEPVRGRVLYAGTVGLRKGAHYLAHAKRMLDAKGIQTEVRIVGPVHSSIVEHPAFQGPIYCGQVPRTRMAEEFRRADVFVLPTISDSFALVHLEALACGVPVITTPNCGSLVRDGLDGFIVPIRDAKMLAERIEQILTDRSLRKRMSENARARAGQFTWELYGERLISAVSMTAPHGVA